MITKTDCEISNFRDIILFEMHEWLKKHGKEMHPTQALEILKTLRRIKRISNDLDLIYDDDETKADDRFAEEEMLEHHHFVSTIDGKTRSCKIKRNKSGGITYIFDNGSSVETQDKEPGNPHAYPTEIMGI